METKIQKPEPLKGFWGFLIKSSVIYEVTPVKDKFIFKSYLEKQELTSHIDFKNAEVWE